MDNPTRIHLPYFLNCYPDIYRHLAILKFDNIANNLTLY